MAWTDLISGFVGAITGGVFALLAICLERYLMHREGRKNARYRLLVSLRELRTMVGREVACIQAAQTDSEDAHHYNDMLSKLALNRVTSGLQDKILDILRENDGLPELQSVRRALWCPGTGARGWLDSLNKAVKELERVVCPNLRKYEDELYRELPADVRRVIEHPETLRTPRASQGEDR